MVTFCAITTMNMVLLTGNGWQFAEKCLWHSVAKTTGIIA